MKWTEICRRNSVKVVAMQCEFISDLDEEKSKVPAFWANLLCWEREGVALDEEVESSWVWAPRKSNIRWTRNKKTIQWERKKKKSCPLPGLNQRPLDLQSNALPAELRELTPIFPKDLLGKRRLLTQHSLVLLLSAAFCLLFPVKHYWRECWSIWKACHCNF